MDTEITMTTGDIYTMSKLSPLACKLAFLLFAGPDSKPFSAQSCMHALFAAGVGPKKQQIGGHPGPNYDLSSLSSDTLAAIGELVVNGFFGDYLLPNEKQQSK